MRGGVCERGMWHLQQFLILHLLLTIAVLETSDIEKNAEKKSKDNLDENEKNLLDVMDGKVFRT